MPADSEPRAALRDSQGSDPMAEHKRRARWRLLGALIIAGSVVALAPVLLEEQARPLSQDLLIEIPSKDSVFAKIESLKSSSEPAVTTEQPPAGDTAPKSDTASAVKPAATPPAAPVVAPAATPATTTAAPAPPGSMPPASKKDPAAILAGTDTPKAEPKASQKPEPKASQKPVTTADGKFLVQVGAYAKIEAANAVKAKLTAGGHTVAIETIKNAEGAERHRVRIGPFATKELATQVRDRAKAQGYDAAVIGP